MHQSDISYKMNSRECADEPVAHRITQQLFKINKYKNTLRLSIQQRHVLPKELLLLLFH